MILFLRSRSKDRSLRQLTVKLCHPKIEWLFIGRTTKVTFGL
ncbi:hypothetical protein PG5_29770 [Pseudomonas sp. G5(2012)]|nr:hypothetical protein PG5_29770 [Pseudomonas sp. G5(2012)]